MENRVHDRSMWQEEVPSEDPHDLSAALKWSRPALPSPKTPRATNGFEQKTSDANMSAVSILVKNLNSQLDHMSQTLARIPACCEHDLARAVRQMRQENGHYKQNGAFFRCGAPASQWLPGMEFQLLGGNSNGKAPFQNDLLVVAEKPPRTCPSSYPDYVWPSAELLSQETTAATCGTDPAQSNGNAKTVEFSNGNGVHTYDSERSLNYYSEISAETAAICTEGMPEAKHGPRLSWRETLSLRKIWKEEGERISMTYLHGVFKVRIKKNMEKVVRPGSRTFTSATTVQRQPSLQRKASMQKLPSVSSAKSEEADTPDRCILHPHSSLRILWNVLTVSLLAWDVLLVPLQAFPVPELTFFDYVDWITTIFWTLDIVVTFRTGYMNGSKIEMRSSRIAMNYARTWLILDLFIVAMEWAGRFLRALIQGGTLLRITRVFRAIRSVKLLRLTKLNQILNAVEDQLNTAAFTLAFALLKMAVVLGVCIHFVSCLWFFIGDSTSDGWVSYANIPECDALIKSTLRGPIPEDDRQAVKELVMWYFYSARWVTAQANGRVDQDARRNIVEMGFTCLVVVFGHSLCMAVFVSKITATMVELNTMAQSKRRTRMMLNQYLSGYSVSSKLTARLKAHVRGRKDLNKEQETEKFILSILPKQLQNDLMYEVRAPIVVAHSFFDIIHHNYPSSIKQVTKQALTPVLTHQDETVFETGDACKRMIFAYRGRFIYSQNDMLAHQRCVQKASDGRDSLTDVKQFDLMMDIDGDQEIGPGVWLCEAAMWLEWQNQGICTALNDGLFLSLEVDSFGMVVKSYLEVFSLVVAYAFQFEYIMKNQTFLSDIIDVELESNLEGHA